MAITTLNENEIAALYSVTVELMDKCHLTQDDTTGKYYYMVESRTTEDTQYTCRYDREHHCFTCNCPAGREGRACWHKRAAMASLTLYKQELRNRREAEAREAEAAATYHEEHSAWAAEVAKATAREAKAVRTTRTNAYNRKAFSLLK